MLCVKSMVGLGSVVASAVGILLTVVTGSAFAGSIFLSGHDPDFHAFLGEDNPPGAQHLIHWNRTVCVAQEVRDDPKG